nr:MAG TPA: hypothetical protein [Caudoviricetes sp.]
MLRSSTTIQIWIIVHYHEVTPILQRCKGD